MDDHRKRKIADGFADELCKMGALPLPAVPALVRGLASFVPSWPSLIAGAKKMIMGGPKTDTTAALNLGQDTGGTSAPTAVPN